MLRKKRKNKPSKEWTPFWRKVSNLQRPVQFRSEKRDSQNETINNLFAKQDKLHSKPGKSTYFYKQWLDSFSSLRKQFANGFWVNLSSSREDSSTPNIPSANRTRFSLKDTNPYSKLTCGGVKYFLPTFCASVLLLVLGLSINPIMHHNSYAIGNEVAAVNDTTRKTTSLGIAWTSPNDLERETYGFGGEVNYRYDTFTLTGSKIEQYQIFVNVASGSSEKLEGYLDSEHTVAIASINGITNTNGVLGSNIPENQWGYAISEGYKTSKVELEQLTYRSLPVSSSTTAAFTGTEETLNNKQFTVAFGANVGNDKPSGHYTAYVTVSAVMEPKTVFSGITEMQEMTASICANASVNDSAQLMDVRDNKMYWVTKLKDGNCWMTQNLDLDLSVNKALTVADSDVQNDWTPANNTQVGENPDFERSYFSDGMTYIPYEVVQSWDPAQGGAERYCVDSKCDNTSTASSNGGHDAQGNYYSWNAATAGTGERTGESRGGLLVATSASDSICPRGWKLPAGGDNAHSAIFNGASESDILSAPYYFVFGGSVVGNALVNVGENLSYWSSTGVATSANFLTFYQDAFTWYYVRESPFGNFVRCVVDDRTLSNLTYMQEMKASVCQNSVMSETKMLLDKRDNHQYWVTKLKDGNCWMTKNLEITNKEITAADSDMSSGEFTIPASAITGFTEADQNTGKAYTGIYGGYYNWFTATAGSGDAPSIADGTNASSSICPKGWQLPVSGNTITDKSYNKLLNGITTDTAIMANPYDFKKGGYVYDGSLNASGANGYYWSATAEDASNAYYMDFDTSVSPSISSPRYSGMNVRCVAR